MSNVVRIVNNALSLNTSESVWLHHNDSITLAARHQLSLHILPDGAKVFVEKKHNTAPCLFYVKHNSWLKLLTPTGFVLIMPKAISSKGVLVQVLRSVDMRLAVS